VPNQQGGRARHHRAEKEKFFAMLEGVVCGDDAQCGKPDPGILLKAAAVLGVPSCICGTQCPRPKSE
jgi:beta-phosphoglucomutase-like phosphatase (HAD superfamily)